MPEVRPLINDGRRIEPAVSVNKITAGWKEVITFNDAVVTYCWLGNMHALTATES